MGIPDIDIIDIDRKLSIIIDFDKFKIFNIAGRSAIASISYKNAFFFLFFFRINFFFNLFKKFPTELCRQPRIRASFSENNDLLEDKKLIKTVIAIGVTPKRSDGFYG